MYKAKTAVCLGSGSGFVPRLMRQAQLDLGIPNSQTILIDANIQSHWGDPDYHDKDCFFTKNFDIQIRKELTMEGAKNFKPNEIDYLHIDADHSYEAVLEDFMTYKNLVGPHKVITMHDTLSKIAGVQRVVQEIKKMPEFEVIDFHIGNGTALIRKV